MSTKWPIQKKVALESIKQLYDALFSTSAPSIYASTAFFAHFASTPWLTIKAAWGLGAKS